MKVELEMSLNEDCRAMLGRALKLGRKPTRVEIEEWAADTLFDEMERLIEQDKPRARTRTNQVIDGEK